MEGGAPGERKGGERDLDNPGKERVEQRWSVGRDGAMCKGRDLSNGGDTVVKRRSVRFVGAAMPAYQLSSCLASRAHTEPALHLGPA